MNESPITDIGPWSEIKIEIIQKYAAAYSLILSKQNYLEHYYIDAFSGAGEHKSRTSGQIVKGSPKAALEVAPAFSRYYFIDIDGTKISYLQNLAANRSDVVLYEGDCNKVLVKEILPKITFADRKRALCLIDPYGLHLDWSVLDMAGKSGAVEIFLNFPLMDMNMNVLKNDQTKVDPKQGERLTRFWGDESWKSVAYDDGSSDLFGYAHKTTDVFVEAFRKRLRNVAGFKYVPEPLPMKNSKNGIVYYLFFASPNSTGGKIVGDIFGKYR